MLCRLRWLAQREVHIDRREIGQAIKRLLEDAARDS
jgi:hypothetical protein